MNPPETDSRLSFSPEWIAHLRQVLAQQHSRLGQLEHPTAQRSLTARNYDSAIRALAAYMQAQNAPLPSRSVLEAWREDMLAGRILSERGTPLALRSINMRLAAVRKLLHNSAAEVLDVTVKLILRDWAGVADAKAIVQQDKLAEDYGLRLSRPELEALVNSIDGRTIKGLRDRALILVMAGAGLRVSEAVQLTLGDVFLTVNAAGHHGIRVRRGKHHKARIVALGSAQHPVLVTVQRYTSALGLVADETPQAHVFRGVQRAPGGAYNSLPQRLSVRGAERAVAAYPAPYRGGSVPVNAHDLRRTFAKLCKEAGMSWEALREQMGHSSVTITENYVGHEVDWAERLPGWTLHLT